jgi:transposase
MAMMSAMQCNPVFKSTYQRLVEEGKSKKFTIIAGLIKMIIILYFYGERRSYVG